MKTKATIKKTTDKAPKAATQSKENKVAKQPPVNPGEEPDINPVIDQIITLAMKNFDCWDAAKKLIGMGVRPLDTDKTTVPQFTKHLEKMAVCCWNSAFYDAPRGVYTDFLTFSYPDQFLNAKCDVIQSVLTVNMLSGQMVLFVRGYQPESLPEIIATSKTFCPDLKNLVTFLTVCNWQPGGNYLGE